MGAEGPSPEYEDWRGNAYPPRAEASEPVLAPASVDFVHDWGSRSKRGCGIVSLLWFACLAFFYFFPDTLPWSGTEEKSPVADAIGSFAIFYCLLIGPTLGLLFGKDVVSYLNWRTKKGGTNVLWRVFIGFWMLLFSALSVAFGCLSIMVGFQHLFKSDGPTHPVLNFILLVMMFGFGLVLIGTGVYFGKRALRRKEIFNEADDLAADAEERRAWAALDFAFLERQLGCALPKAYKAMMQPGSEWRKKCWILYPRGLDHNENDGVECYNVQSLQPPHPTALGQHPTTGEVLVCFAWSATGGYFLKPGTEDPPVYLISQDVGPDNIKEVTPCLSVFLSWPREGFVRVGVRKNL
jgi:hypothetical protein